MSENTQTQNQQFDGPFDAVAYLLMIARLGMENKNMPDEPHRYARIARAWEVKNATQIAEWLKEPADWAIDGVKGLNFFISRLITLTLQARDVLKGSDAILALTEIALEMIDVVISPEFWTTVGKSFGPAKESTEIPSNTVIPEFTNGKFDLPKIKNWLEYIPDPEDLNRIGYELYRMSNLAYNAGHTIDVESTGKLRLLQYTFEQYWDVYLKDEYVQTQELGQEEGEIFNGTPIVYNPDEGGPSIPLFTPNGDQTADVTKVLTELGYDSADPINNIRLFQKLNNLPTEGQLNEETINRFFNLDSEYKNLVWAKEKEGSYVDGERYPMGYLPLVNGNADDYASEGLPLATEPGFKYRYYEIRTENIFPTDGQGWVRKNPGPDGDVTYINGFVALESRFMNLNRKPGDPIYEGGRLSEGEAASGRFFFSARDTEPWFAGRKGQPTSTLIYDDAQTAPQQGQISRMYQDIEETIVDLLSKAPSGELINNYDIAFEASCLRRSLYTNRSNEAEIRDQPDQGRILLEVHEDDNTTPVWTDPLVTAEGGGWEPGALVTKTFTKSEARINQRNNWFKQTSSLYVIDAASLIDGDTNGLNFGDVLGLTFTVQSLRLRVILEGRHRKGWDTDAYFDDVRLKWMFVQKPA